LLKEIKDTVTCLLAENRVSDAVECMRSAWEGHATPALAAFICIVYSQNKDQLESIPLKVAIQRSVTLEPMVSWYKAEAFLNGFDLDVYVGAFDAYAQELLSEESKFCTFDPDVTLLYISAQSLIPELWHAYGTLDQEAIQEQKEKVLAVFKLYLEQYTARFRKPLIIHTLEQFPHLVHGLADVSSELQQRDVMSNLNREIVKLARQCPGVYVLDINEVILKFGTDNWFDRERWLTMRLPFKQEAFQGMARLWCRMLFPLTGRTAKVIVCDLDNTLWGGVIGEDGIEGIKLDAEFPGAAYQGLQRALLDLKRAGFLLAVCSKNNESDAMEVINQHQGMILKQDDFATFRINWQDKASNLREIAQELNVGTESLVFVDDNPAECQWVRQSLPEVTVLELPKDNPLQYETLVRNHPRLVRLHVTKEDLGRTGMYLTQKKRGELKLAAASLEDFYMALNMEMEVLLVDEKTVDRVAQLTQKTNQFNLTTHRYSTAEIQSFVENSDWDIRAFRVSDSYGDQGIVGVVMCHVHEEEYHIHNFLMSCRVIGRTIETAMLATIFSLANERNLPCIIGSIIPTQKNRPVRDFYQKHGFLSVFESAAQSQWMCQVTQRPQMPEWIRTKEGIINGRRSSS